MTVRRERGSATLFAVAVVGLLVMVGGALAVVGAMVHAHRVAQAAADLAALSAARALADSGDPCGVAATVAQANGASLDGCEVESLDVRIAVTVAGPHWLGQPHDLSAQARAGPAG